VVGPIKSGVEKSVNTVSKFFQVAIT
jgi:hypothetical protein